MNLLIPVHQFEIRYTQMLNFQSIIRDVLAPFVRMANNIQIDNENSIYGTYHLSFDNDEYTIRVMWDRIIFKTEGDINRLRLNNSIVEDPFFNIFSRIEATNGFGVVNNMLFYTIGVYNDRNITVESAIKTFQEKYFIHNQIENIIGHPTDLGISIEHYDKTKQLNVTIRPYLGINNLIGISAVPNDTDLYEECLYIGEIAAIKLLETTKIANFKVYKEFYSETTKIINKIWS